MYSKSHFPLVYYCCSHNYFSCNSYARDHFFYVIKVENEIYLLFF